MIYDFIIDNYQYGEPIFLNELPGKSKDYLRQEMKKLVDDGKLERLYNGVYFLPYVTILGTKGKMSVDRYIEKKYLVKDGNTSGYVTGLQLANQYGFTTQNPAYYEVCSNEASTKQRKQVIDGNTIVVYKPVASITDENKFALQFLDLMSMIDKYSEISGLELADKLKKYVNLVGLDFSVVKKYLPFYPDRVYRNIYEGGLMGELV
ncbi:Transcriptional regulator, AbiEi antitoxin, Type IV TA system [Lachnospiraceae bacterium XBB1006]|nr:Transcriptional regulator, AbiEi antitoxin, Type IV TA system [Lachnospiraceae bacterium XBB1006]